VTARGIDRGVGRGRGIGRGHGGGRGRGVSRDAAFRRLWAGMTVSRLGTSVAGVATPLIAVQVLDASALTVSLLTAAAWLPWLIIGLPAGAWIDRVAKRPVMLACDTISALLVVSVPLAAWLYHLTIVQLLIVAALTGTASVFFQVAWIAYLPAMFDEGDLVGANAILQGSESATQIAGPAVGGALIAAVSAVAGLVVDSLSFAVSAVSLLLIRRPERSLWRRPQRGPIPAARRSITRDIVEGVRWVAREPFLRNLTIHGAAGNLALTGYGAITIVFLVRDVGLGTGTVGLLLAASGLGGVAAATATPYLVRRFGAARTMIRCKIGAGVASLLIPLTSSGAGLIAFFTGTALVSAFVVIGNVVAGSFRQAFTPPDLLGRVVTSMQFVNYGTIPIGAVLGGTIATAAGTRGAVAVMTIGYACSGLILALGPWRGRRDLPNRPSTDDRGLAAPEPATGRALPTTPPREGRDVPTTPLGEGRPVTAPLERPRAPTT
jgi:MFS family permease